MTTGNKRFEMVKIFSLGVSIPIDRQNDKVWGTSEIEFSIIRPRSRDPTNFQQKDDISFIISVNIAAMSM